MYLYVGLGNPGPAYKNTRHNIGFMVIDSLVAETDTANISKRSFEGELYRRNGLFFLKPVTYMNLSGKSVRKVMDFFKIPLENLVVIHDDIDLAFGTMRFKRGGGSGGHNGLKSIDAAIGNDYLRVRLGIGKPPNKSMTVDYVLNSFEAEERSGVEELVQKAVQACLMIPKLSLEKLKSEYTVKKVEGD